MWKPLLLAAVSCWMIGAAAADESGTGCLTSPDLVGQCFVVHGRLSWHANMRPYLWPVGTSRLLGFPEEIHGLRRWLPESVDPDAPGSVYKRAAPLLAEEVDVMGDFEVCPVSRERPHVMRMVCLARASNLRLLPQTDGPERRSPPRP